MSLPQHAEYDDAIQNPRFAFIDPELQNGTNDGPMQFGMPGLVASGNFAVVYRFRCGARRIAVKCFTREKNQQQLRYELIHEHIAAQKLPWTVDFTYLKKGIRVKGNIYPILKMEWVENAKTLFSYITEAVNTGQALDSICDQFYRMATDLKKHSIAHGDLQHGNLIVSDGRLLLIDYDGMCVPKTAGFKSEEDGLPDYQHPLRNGGTLQSTLDHFSTLVIWTSLYALTIDPALWQRWVKEDERLLFCKADFIRPDDSSLIQELLSFGDPKMTTAVEAIAKAASTLNLEQIPHLAEVVKGAQTPSATPWWQTSEAIPTTSETEVHNEQKTLPLWIASNQPQFLSPILFKGGTSILSFFSALSLASFLIGTFLTVSGAVAISAGIIWGFGTIAIYGSVLHFALSRRPELDAKNNSKRTLLKAAEEERKIAPLLQLTQAPYFKTITQLEQIISQSEATIKRLESSIETAKQRALQQLQTFSREQTEKRRQAEKIERDAVSHVGLKRTTAKSQHDSQVLLIDRELSSALTRFTTQASMLASQAERDKEARYAAKFDVFVQSELAKIGIGMAPVGGVSTYELNRNGFHTLADFTDYGYEGCLKHKSGRYIKVRGIGTVRGRELVAWRKQRIERIRQQLPAGEREAINNAIDAETRKERERLESVRDVARSKAAQAKLHAKAEFDGAIADADRLQSQGKRSAKAALDALSSADTAFRGKNRADEVAATAPLSRELWALQSVVNPARYRLKAEREKMNAATRNLTQKVAEARIHHEAAKQEAARYARICYVGFIKHVLT